MYILLRKVTAPAIGTETYIEAVDWMGRNPQWQLPYRDLLKTVGRGLPSGIDHDTLLTMLRNNMVKIDQFIFELPMWQAIDWTIERNKIPVITQLDLERMQYAIDRGAKPIETKIVGDRQEVIYFLKYDYCRATDAALETHCVGERELMSYLEGKDDLSLRGQKQFASIYSAYNPYRVKTGALA